MDDEVATEEPTPQRHDDGSLVVAGETTLNELDHDHGIAIAQPDVTTIAALVLARHGTVPAVGTTVDADGFMLTVDEVDGRKITRIRVRPSTVA
jgi:CBS domain containing-hemolysin-like protein